MWFLLLLLWNEQTNKSSAAAKQQEALDAEKGRLRNQILASMPPVPIDPAELERQQKDIAARLAQQEEMHEQMRRGSLPYMLFLMVSLVLLWFFLL